MFKYKGAKPVRLSELPEEMKKARTIARGDRFKYGVDFEETASPVAAAPVNKMVIAWAVQKGFRLFKLDQSGAFYGNPMDRSGIWVKAPVGFHPTNDEIT